MDHNEVKMGRRQVLKTGAAFGAAAMLGLGGGKAFASDKPFVPFSNKSLSYYFFAIEQEAVKRAVESHGWAFQATNANFDTSEQLRQWQSLMLKQPAGIVCDPIDSQAIVSAINRYRQKGIPVAIIDTPAAGGDVNITVSFDNYLGGVMAAKEIVSRLIEKYGSPKGTVLNCYGALQSVAWRERKEGMDSVFEKYPEINYLARPTEGLLSNMQATTLSTLSEYPDLDAVHSPSDSPARGIVTALKQKDRWRKVGQDDHVIFVTIDGEPSALKWIQEDYQDACISQDPVAYGQIAVEMIGKYGMKNKPVPTGLYENTAYYWEKGKIVDGETGPTLVIPPYVIDSSNAKDKRHWGYIAEQVWGIEYN